MNSATVFSVGSSEAFSLLSSVWTSSSADSDDAAETPSVPTDQESDTLYTGTFVSHIDIDDARVIYLTRPSSLIFDNK
ncbi:hypothetical protein DFJ43DRAFT_1151966 [Lentinula guzmanii]|uniref:Uncharacterized protein n=1 Tax=Lentinula guzmanii TaxID=2804957 RepID=A0AA38JPU6_9AGAR|nr:hypothetical protein DFJ43DRAFT_1151966 [Lentinula guzmanii]